MLKMNEQMLRRTALVTVVIPFLVPPVPAGANGDERSSPVPATKELSPEDTEHFLGRVRRKLGTLESLRADFIQERFMAAFVDTLTAKGICYFKAPDKIRWELRDPYRSALVFNKGHVAKFLYDDDRPRKLNPGSKEVMKEVLNFIAMWLRGDFEASREFFDLQVEQGEDFLVRLTPRAAGMQEMIERIELAVDGDDARIKRVTIRERRGDRIVITFVHEKRNIELEESLFALD